MRNGALGRLTPPWPTLEVGQGDKQERGLFVRRWHSQHYSEQGIGLCELEDRIDYTLPLGKLGELICKGQVHERFNTLFEWRHERIRMDLSRHTEFAGRPRLRVAISGASGMIGKNLMHFLTTGGHTVIPIVRSRGLPGTVYWNPQQGEIEAEGLEGVNSVVHLAGKSIAEGRWTESRKREILESRIKGTTLIAETVARLKQPPQVLISASAVGIYSESEEPVTEDGPQASGFLAEVCRAWEAAAEPAREAGIRVVHPRISTVISGRGGMLGKLLPIFKAGLGGRVGSGRQTMSWIHLDDLLAAFYKILYDVRLTGPINASTNQPITNQEFTRTLGRILKRPTFASVPEAAVKLAFGQMGQELLLQGVNAKPAALDKIGFVPWFPDLESALRFETGKPFPHAPPFHPTSLPQSGPNGYLIS